MDTISTSDDLTTATPLKTTSTTTTSTVTATIPTTTTTTTTPSSPATTSTKPTTTTTTITSTALTNLQRGNVKHLAAVNHNKTIHELAAQGEIRSLIGDASAMSNVDALDCDLLTPLIWAAGYGQNSIVEHLLKQNANINHKSRGNKTALMFAAANGFLNVVKTLIDHNANIDDFDDSGNTALMYAAYNNHTAIIEELLKAGADLTMTNFYSFDAYGICISKNNTQAMATFRAFLLSILSRSSQQQTQISAALRYEVDKISSGANFNNINNFERN